MTEQDYIREAVKTEQSVPTDGVVLTRRQFRLLHSAMGMATEACEFLDMMKKHIFYGKEFDLVNAIEEMGDSEWYKAIFMDETGLRSEHFRGTNVAKLRKRYSGAFNKDEAINRDTIKEREVLEYNANATTS